MAIRVLHLIDHMGCGGAQTIIKDFLETRKSDRGHFLYGLRSVDDLIVIDHPNVFRESSSSRYSLMPLWHLRTFIKKYRIGILHCHLFRSQVCGWFLKRFCFPKLKLIFHEHGDIFERKTLHLFLLQRMKNDVDLFIAVSRATVQQLIDHGQVPEKKIELVLNGVNTGHTDLCRGDDDIVQALRRDFGIDEQGYVIGYVGRLEPQKGCDYLIEAFSALKIPAQLVIVGDGGERKKLVSLAEQHQIIDRIKFVGFQSDIRPIVKLIDVLVMPSRWDPCPRMALEAQLYGVPLIASNVDGIPEILPDMLAGILFEKGDVAALTEKLTLLYHDHDLRTRLIQGAKENIRRFDMSVFSKSVDGLYRNLCEEKPET